MAHSETGVDIYQNAVFMIEAASWCPGNSCSDTKNQTPDDCCEGKDTGALAGRSHGNKAVLFCYGFFFFSFSPFFFLMERDLSAKEADGKDPGERQSVSLLQGKGGLLGSVSGDLEL